MTDEVEPDLDEIFSDTQAETVEETIEETPTAEATEEPEQTEETEETKGVKDKADSTPETDREWTKVAALDERRKRQEAERERDELRAKLLEKESPEEDRPDIFEDQKGALDSVLTTAQKAIVERTMRLSRATMMRHYPDYTDKEAAFVQLAKDDPRLVEDMWAADDPAGFAYDTAIKHEKLEALKTQDPDKLREQIREEVRQELLKEAEAKKEAEDELDSATKTPSLAKSRAAGTANDAGEESLEDILG